MFSPIFLSLYFVLGASLNATVRRRQQQNCQCPCYVCKNVCEPSRNFFGVLGDSKLDAAGHDFTRRKEAMSQLKSEDSPDAFQNVLPFVAPSTESRALTEVARPTADVENDSSEMTMAVNVVQGPNSEIFSVMDTENNRQVTIKKSLPAPVNDLAVEQIFRKNDLLKLGAEQPIKEEDTRFSEDSTIVTSPITKNSDQDNEDDENKLLTSPSITKDITGIEKLDEEILEVGTKSCKGFCGKTYDYDQDYKENRNQMQTNEVVKRNSTNGMDNAAGSAPEFRAQSCGSSCDGSADYDPYIWGTFSGTKTETFWPPSQEPKEKEPKESEQQSAHEYYDEVENAASVRTTLLPYSNLMNQHAAKPNFMNKSLDNICKLCAINNIQVSGSHEQNHSNMSSSFRKYNVVKSKPLGPKVFADNDTFQQVNNINDSSFRTNASSTAENRKLQNLENPPFLEFSNLINLTDKLGSLTTVRAFPLVADFRSQKRTNSLKVKSGDMRELDMSPPSLLMLERRLTNDTAGSVVKPTRLASAKTQTNKSIKEGNTLGETKQILKRDEVIPLTSLSKINSSTQRPFRVFVASVIRNMTNKDANLKSSKLEKQSPYSSNSTGRVSRPVPNASFQVSIIRRTPEQKFADRFPSHAQIHEMKRLLSKFRSALSSEFRHRIPGINFGTSRKPSNRRRKQTKILEASTSIPIESTLFSPPIEHRISRKSIPRKRS